MKIPTFGALLSLLLSTGALAAQEAQHPPQDRLLVIERSLWRAPLAALDPEPRARWSEVVAPARGSCLGGALTGGGAGAVVGVGWLALNSDGDLFGGPRERNFALIAVGAGALIGCALASG